jgi:O-antigen ligase
LTTLTAPTLSTSASRITPSVWLIVLYILGTRISPDGVGKLGFSAGGIPVYSTEVLIGLLLITVFLRRPTGLMIWLASGSGAGFAGVAVWLLFWSSIVYTIRGFPAWRLLAIRDLAIFGYSLIFVLAYFTIDTRDKALFVLKAFIYAGAITAILLVGDSLLGLHILFKPELRGVAGSADTVASIGGGDIGAAVAVSVGPLILFAAKTSPDDSRMRFVYLGLIGLCMLALIITQTRSASVGAALSVAVAVTGLSGREATRLALILLASACIGGLFAAVMPGEGGERLIASFWATLQSGSELTEDPNFAFRYLRWVYVANEWRSSPLFGMGFGVPLVPPDFISEDEVGLNAGMPHNTYLTVLARMGVFGLTLIVLPWLHGILLCFRRRTIGDASPDYQRMTSSILVFFAGFAGFVLFFERPWHSAPFWIMLAIANRLSEPAKTVPYSV